MLSAGTRSKRIDAEASPFAGPKSAGGIAWYRRCQLTLSHIAKQAGIPAMKNEDFVHLQQRMEEDLRSRLQRRQDRLKKRFSQFRLPDLFMNLLDESLYGSFVGLYGSFVGTNLGLAIMNQPSMKILLSSLIEKPDMRTVPAINDLEEPAARVSLEKSYILRSVTAVD
jgi:hypothetical protein